MSARERLEASGGEVTSDQLADRLVVVAAAERRAAREQSDTSSGSRDRVWLRSVPARVLLVEDDPTILEVLCAVLSDEGYVARGVETVAAALKVLGCEPVECVVLDFHLPDGTAEDILSVASANDQCPPMMIVSASPVAPPVAHRFGVPLLRKPFDIDDVVSCVAAAIRSGRSPKDTAER